ncbi:MAG: hypothetical protein WD646_02420 [Actinomycetota bacterium]
MSQIILRAAAVAVVLLFAACGTNEDPGIVGTPPVETEPAATSSPSVHTIEVTVTDGMPVGGVKREEVDTGEDVRIVVSSDVSDEVHLHGYDESVDVEAGDQAVLEFTADIEGVFIVELEERGEHILEIEVK